MEQKENLFNKTSLRIEKRVEQLFKDTFSILTEFDFNTKEFSEKEKNLLSSLIDYHSDEILFGFIKEKIYEFCKNNKDLKLIFVSADQNFIKAIDILMEYLCFDDCVNLIEFSNN